MSTLADLDIRTTKKVLWCWDWVCVLGQEIGVTSSNKRHGVLFALDKQR